MVLLYIPLLKSYNDISYTGYPVSLRESCPGVDAMLFYILNNLSPSIQLSSDNSSSDYQDMELAYYGNDSVTESVVVKAESCNDIYKNCKSARYEKCKHRSNYM